MVSVVNATPLDVVEMSGSTPATTLSMSFFRNSASINRMSVDFGDGTVSSLDAPSHTYIDGAPSHPITVSCNMHEVEIFSITSAQLSGDFVDQATKILSLERLSLYSNDAVGSISSRIGGLIHLTNLSLYNSDANGVIPPDISGAQSLDTLYVDRTDVTGVLPSELSQCTALSKFSAHSTLMTTSIPIEYSSLVELVLFYLYNITGLTSGLPVGVSAWTKIQRIYINNNSMSAADVDSSIDNIYAARAVYTHSTKVLRIDGSNAAASGNFVAPPASGVSDIDWSWNGSAHDPLTGKAKIYALINDPNLEGFNKWTINYTA